MTAPLSSSFEPHVHRSRRRERGFDPRVGAEVN